ncbi:twin-arginine translocase TatA/TatE family subunit [Halotalea alkalilenta]|uniref:Sec-independent protein translocase protein TatA n=1 Tax=Halotalea alkalilenta TaxID=376489 RepID=A0A172YFL5_9GAMM|nr:twin-arginine translocase TatA/TatE family subunit [Halotalea alkalilenta]ANF58023.1 preprotein translocase subunit SecE [Halotalea alkalilenta]
MLSGLSIGHLLVTLAVILLVFGTNRLRSAGGDLGTAIKAFKSAVKDDEAAPDTADAPRKPDQQ